MLSKNADGLYGCMICKQFAADSGKSLSAHVHRVHGKGAQEYYDEHCREDGEGTCKVCGKPTRFISLSNGYRDACSLSCSRKLLLSDPVRASAMREKSEATSMERYGTPHAGTSPQALAKARKTNMERRGVEYAAQDPTVQAKRAETCEERYGATTYLQSEVGSAAIRKTNLDKYGREYFFAGEAGKEASRKAYMEKHGVDHNMHDPEFLERWRKEQFAQNDGKYFVQTKEFRKKSKETQFEKYGNWYAATDEGRAAYRRTIMERFGVDEYFRTDEFKEKSASTMAERYGADNYAKTSEWAEKVQITNNEKYGVPFVTQSDAMKSASSATCEEKYGVPNYAMTAECQGRISDTNRVRYGVDRVSQLPDWAERHAATMRRKYGADSYMGSEAYRRVLGDRYESMMDAFNCHVESVDSWWSVRFRCDVCGSECTEQAQFIRYRIRGHITPCTCCMPKNPPVSVGENEVRLFIEGLGHKVDHYDSGFLGGYGADIVVEDSRVIVEYDGLYWHSELFHDSAYHMRKTLLAEEMGYRLVHVFSDEWTYKKDIVKARLRYLLHDVDGLRIYARKCTVRLVDSMAAREFLYRNHIQGSVNSPYRYGLYNGETLVALMTFGKSRFESNVVELLRFCSDRDMNVVGGASKLFSAFLKDHPDISHVVSYADARWSTGHAFYEKLGFELTAMSSPGYFIVDGDIRKSRMQFQRHKIAGTDDEGKTEHEITLERGLFRIYDCGQYRYDWTRSES